MSLATMAADMRAHLTEVIIPFWCNLMDTQHGGFYGRVDQALHVDKTAIKGCILNSRILWFYSTAYRQLEDPVLLKYAQQAYAFAKRFIDKEHGGVYFSLTHDGKPAEDFKLTYCQAFAIYGLSAYARATGDREALALAMALRDTVETYHRDKDGYLEEFARDHSPLPAKRLTEGHAAERTMNTYLHLMEAYTELYLASRDSGVKQQALDLLDTITGKIYNPQLRRQEVFLDRAFRSLADIYSYGHDIECSWLVDETAHAVCEEAERERLAALTTDMARCVAQRGMDGPAVILEEKDGHRELKRVWWVEAEGVVGFANAYLKTGDATFLQLAENVWAYIQQHLIDPRPDSEWFAALNGSEELIRYDIVEPWKCPYHNGRMCLEIMRMASAV